MRHGHFFLGGGWTKSYLSMYLVIVFLLFSKNFLARYARSIAFYPQLTNAICFTNAIYIFFVHFWCHYPRLPASKVHWKLHKIAYKMSKNCLRGWVGGGEAWQKRGESWEWGERHGCWGIDPLHAGKLDHIGVGAYSTLAGGDIFCQRLCMNKISEILHHICPKK